MDWSTILGIAAVNLVLIGWMRSDMKQFENKIETLISEIQKEIKDFHGRLCAIEEKNKK